MERVSAGEPECRIVSVMQGAEGTGKDCQLVTVTAKSAASELADLPMNNSANWPRRAAARGQCKKIVLAAQSCKAHVASTHLPAFIISL